MSEFFGVPRSVIPALDFSEPDALVNAARACRQVPDVKAVKIGIAQIRRGLEWAVDTIRTHAGSNIRIIYDHQKAANDIPDMGAVFAREMRLAGVDAAIIFPFAGPTTQKDWTRALQDEGLTVFTGGIMTHPQFLRSEGGYIANEAPSRIFELAAHLGVEHFILPGNKLAWITLLTNLLNERLGVGNYTCAAPGFLTQGGDITEAGRLAGERFHPIVGRDFYGRDRRNSQDEMLAALVRSVRNLHS